MRSPSVAGEPSQAGLEQGATRRREGEPAGWQNMALRSGDLCLASNSSASSQAFPWPHHARSKTCSFSPKTRGRTQDRGLELPQFLQNKLDASPLTLAKLPQIYSKMQESRSLRLMHAN